MPSKYKDPDAELYYGFDWSDWLSDGETISTSTWIVDAGITASDDSFVSTGETRTLITGGTAGSRYVITNRITTSLGQTDDRSATLVITDR